METEKPEREEKIGCGFALFLIFIAWLVGTYMGLANAPEIVKLLDRPIRVIIEHKL